MFYSFKKIRKLLPSVIVNDVIGIIENLLNQNFRENILKLLCMGKLNFNDMINLHVKNSSNDKVIFMNFQLMVRL
jgi:hypothetical protein